MDLIISRRINIYYKPTLTTTEGVKNKNQKNYPTDDLKSISVNENKNTLEINLTRLHNDIMPHVLDVMEQWVGSVWWLSFSHWSSILLCLKKTLLTTVDLNDDDKRDRNVSN